MTLVAPVRGTATRHSIDTWGDSYMPSVTSITTLTWPTANRAFYVPLPVRSRVIVRQLWLASQSTGTGNVDIGIYNPWGTRLVSAGSTAKVASITEQVFNVTDTTIGPGLYYWALSCSNATDTFGGLSFPAPVVAAYGVLSEVLGSVTLPATATWTLGQALNDVPMGGMLLETVAT